MSFFYLRAFLINQVSFFFYKWHKVSKNIRTKINSKTQHKSHGNHAILNPSPLKSPNLIKFH